MSGTVGDGSSPLAAQLDALVALECEASRLEAEKLCLLADMIPPADPDLVEDACTKMFVREEIACALRQPVGTVQARLDYARELTTRLGDTLDVLAAGDITLRHATVVADAVVTLSDRQTAALQKRVLERAGNETVAALRRSVRRAVLAVDPEGAERRHEAKKADRDVRLVPEDDAMATLYASLSADAAARVMTRIEAIASVTVPGDTRTMAQRRADALVQLITHDCEALGPLLAREPSWHGRKPSVQVSVALSTLLGFDEEPGELAGHGPIFAGLARRIAADLSGTWRRLVTDRVGRLLDYGRSTYRPPQDLTDFVIARDQTSRFPYSDVPAQRCDIDHQRDWNHGGHTKPANLESLTSRQHHLKHEADWVVTGDPAGPLTWTSPAGRVYISDPTVYPVDRTLMPSPIHEVEGDPTRRRSDPAGRASRRGRVSEDEVAALRGSGVAGRRLQ